MYSRGMYDYSGEWAFRVGLPAKSGVSGVILIVVPNVLGMVDLVARLRHSEVDDLRNGALSLERHEDVRRLQIADGHAAPHGLPLLRQVYDAHATFAEPFDEAIGTKIGQLGGKALARL